VRGINVVRSERFRRLTKEGIGVVLGQAAAVAGAVVGVRLLTELLDPAAWGELALGMTAGTLVNQTVLAPLVNGVTRYYSVAAEQDDLRGYLAAVRRLVLSASGVIGLLALVAVVGLLLAGRSGWIGIATASLLFCVLSGYSAFLGGIQSAARQRTIVALHQAMESWGRYLLAAAFVLWLRPTSTAAMAGYAIAAVPVLVSQYYFFRKLTRTPGGGPPDVELWKDRIWKYSAPFVSWGVFSWAQQSSDRWALEAFATTRDVGLYAVLFQLGYYPVSMATGLAVQFLAPILYQRAGSASDGQRTAQVNHLSWRLTGLTLGVTGVVFLTALLLHHQIFWLLVARQYTTVSHLLPWILLASGLFAAGQALALNLMSQMRTQAMAFAKISTCVLGIAFNFAGAYWFGINGIVVAGILFSASYFLLLALVSTKAVPVPPRTAGQER
jgi:O-antigen/teichoic acid export membrane protein